MTRVGFGGGPRRPGFKAHNELLDGTAISNLYTMGLTAKYDIRQDIGAPYSTPTVAARVLRSRLMIEEPLETAEDLGIGVFYKGEQIKLEDLEFRPIRDEINMEGAIDGCCDTVYVSYGTLISMGVAPGPHMAAVNLANDAKFPKGEVTLLETGKFGKPSGWSAPNHSLVRRDLFKEPDLRKIFTTSPY